MGETTGAPAHTAQHSDPRQLRRVAVASAIGTTIEWYDYFIYSTAAALVFGSQFFSSLSPASGTLAAFATLGVGFLARPVGGVLWGHFGDRIGRKSMLVASLILMGVATVGVGLLPTYGQIGVLAPVLLLVLRLLQGVSAGGEWGGAALMAVEHAPSRHRGRYGSFSQVGVPAGLILAQLVFFVVGNTLSDEQFASWGWRLPFLFSIVLVGVGLFIRLRIEESPVFRTLRTEQARSTRPLIEVARKRPRELLLASVSFIANTAIGYIFLAYLLSYGTSVLKVSRNVMLVVVIIGSVTWLLSIVGSAIWSDRIGRKPVYLLGAGLHVALAFPFFALIETRNVPLILLAWVLGYAVANGALFATQPAFFSELFGTKVRYSGISIGYQFSAMIAGGIAPFVATGLVAWAGGATWPVSLYWMAVGLITFATTLLCRETAVRRVAAEGSP